jgi:hypothetical protein
MAIRETIRVYSQVDIPRYLALLRDQYGAHSYPNASDVYLVDRPALPFRRPVQTAEYLFIEGLDWLPLSSLLIVSLVMRPELAAPHTPIAWLMDQEVLLAATLSRLAHAR